jgi:outer membrane protein assembly factor BamB
MTPKTLARFSVVLAALALTATGCATIDRFNPFNRADDGPLETAGEGERISIIAADEQLTPAEALKGVDFSLPPAVAMTDWPLPGGSPEQSIGQADTAPNLSVVWRRGFGAGSKGGRHVTAPPVAAAGRVFVMDGEATVSARDARTGAEVWSRDLTPRDNRRDREGFGGGVAYSDGKIYVTSGYRLVAQLDAATGAVGWTTRTSEALHGAPTVAGGRIIAVAIDNTLLTFDTATGAPGWTYQALSEPARILAASSPAVSGDTVVAAFGSGELVALRTVNGNDLWNEALSRASRTSALSEIRDIAGRPVIYQGDVFAVSHSGVFSATDLRTGQARWSLPVVGLSAPWPAGDVVYVVSKAGEVICASRESGQIYWVRNLNADFVAPKQDGFLGLGLGGGGRKVRPIWTGPLLANDRLLIAGTTGELVSLNAKTGEIQRRVNLGEPVLMAPIAVGDTIYVVSDTAQLIALR